MWYVNTYERYIQDGSHESHEHSNARTSYVRSVQAAVVVV
jgi:hypothetical protein